MTTLRPETAEGVLDAVRWAAAEETPLEIYAHASKRGIGRPLQAEHELDLSGLSGVTLYEPEELVLSAKAGTPLAEIETLVGEKGQMLAFEPMDFGPLFGGARGRGTLGGVLAGNVSGPRRIKAGAARDHILGVNAVSGRGEAFKSGGRVVKNVTGYDLSKGLAGSWGTLAVVTDLTFKVLPRPEASATLVVAGLDELTAITALCKAMGTPLDVSGAAHLPETLVAEVPDAAFASGGKAATLIRLEGVAPSVDYRAQKLTAAIGRLGEVAVLEDESSEAVWRAVRDAAPFGVTSRPVWRVSVAPNAGPGVVAALRPKHKFRHFYDWSGGLIWIEVDDKAKDALAGVIRAAVAEAGGGHATLVRGSPALRTAVEPFEPQPEGLAALSRRLREQFDPRGILESRAHGGEWLMQTSFSLAQLADPNIKEADSILRRCVHCGFCLATCPTYLELGNELDSPRGRIYLIKDMLENDKRASKEVATHIDRCLSCLSCVTTCPSGVDYMHLVDQARVRIEKTYRRPLGERLIRALLARTLPYRSRFRAVLRLARIGRPFIPVLRGIGFGGARFDAMLKLAPTEALPKNAIRPGVSFTTEEERRGRVALLNGCAQSVLDPGINVAAVRLLSRFGVEVVFPRAEGCCGAIVHHMGRERQAKRLARANIDAWIEEIEGEGLDAILTTTSGCGTTIKDYGHLFRHDRAYADKAARVSALALDISEYLALLELPKGARRSDLVVAYHAACSLQHGQRVTSVPKALLKKAGFEVRDIPEGHICCGSAGTYNMLQPEIAMRLRDRKVKNIEAVAPDVIATGNIGCMTQIRSGTNVPVLHTVELLDWAYGNDHSDTLARRFGRARRKAEISSTFGNA